MTVSFHEQEYPTLLGPGTPYENYEPLPKTLAEDGKSFPYNKNPSPTDPTRSQTYTSFPSPIGNDPKLGSFDVHIYYFKDNKKQAAFAEEMTERIRLEFPELRVKFWGRSIGPHPIAMFEINLFKPEQFGAFVPWLVVNRGQLSCLIHPHTGNGLWDHSKGSMWLGDKVPLDTSYL